MDGNAVLSSTMKDLNHPSMETTYCAPHHHYNQLTTQEDLKSFCHDVHVVKNITDSQLTCQF
jgi:hypothetical protein